MNNLITKYIFESPRLKARYFGSGDVSVLNELHSDKIVVSTTSGSPQTIKETSTELLAMIAHLEKYGVAQMAFFDKMENFIGRCGIIYRSFATEDDFSYEIRYAIHRSFQGLGYGAEAVFSYLNYIFTNQKIEIDTVIAGVRLDGHEASTKILTKVGFHYVGNKIFRGNGKETRMYEINKRDWKLG